MKAMHKQLWGYLLITLSLAGFTPLQAQTDSADEGGYITVSGIVKDKKSKKSLEYVNISIPGSTTVSVSAMLPLFFKQEYLALSSKKDESRNSFSPYSRSLQGTFA